MDYFVERHFTYMIFPFKTKNTFTDVENIRFERSNGKKHPIWEREALHLNKPQDDFCALFDMNNEQRNTVKMYRFNPNLSNVFGVSKTYEAETKLGKTDVYVEGLYLYLFKTGIGFFVMKMHYDTQEAAKILDLNYVLSEKRKEAYLFEKEDAEHKNPIPLLSFLQKALADYMPIKDFDGEQKLQYINRKPLNYSYYFLDKKPEGNGLGQLIFDARSNYVTAYKAPDEALTLDTPYNIQTFENSYWGVSVNGATNVSYKTGDERADNFFAGEFIQRLQGTYFAMYLLVLNRYFALKELRGRYSELDRAKIYTSEQTFKEEICKGKMSREFLKRMERREKRELTEYCEKVKVLNNEATIFSLENAMIVPSNIEHVNEVYELMNKIYGIEELKNSLLQDVKSAKAIGDSYASRLEKVSDALKDLKKTKTEIFIYLMITLYGFLEIFHDLVDIVGYFLGFEILNTPYIWIPWAIILIPVGVLVIKIISSIRDYFEKRKTLEDLIMK